MASSSVLMSASDNSGRSTLIVNLLSLAISGNGGWYVAVLGVDQCNLEDAQILKMLDHAADLVVSL